MKKKSLPIFEQSVRWLDIYFSGKTPDFTPPLCMQTTPFFVKAVWEIMLTIPFGKTMTYGEIADRIAKQKGLSKMSAQAVGGAVGHNSISLIIPCHRVVGTNGALTGYSGGIEKKSTTSQIGKSRYDLIFCAEERNSLMISSNAKTIQKSFTEQAKNFETKSMNFTKQEYLEHMISYVKPQKKSNTVLEVAAGDLYLWALACSVCEKKCGLP